MNYIKIKGILLIGIPTILIFTLAGCPGVGITGTTNGNGNGGGGAFNTELEFDGSISGDVSKSSTGAVTADTGTSISVGDAGVNQIKRGFLTFGLGPLPADASVTSATLHVHQFTTFGDPFNDLGDLGAHVIDYGTSLDDNDFYAAVGAGPYVVSSTNGDNEWRTADITAALQTAMGQPGNTLQLMFKFPTDYNSDSNADQVLVSGPDSGSEEPYVTVEYN